MSRRVAAADRLGGPHEYYPTPSWCVDRLLEGHLFFPRHKGPWLEPASGDGAIVRGVRQYYGTRRLVMPAFHSIDPFVTLGADLAEHSRHHAQSFFDWAPGHAHYAVAITNTPFSMAERFASKLMTVARHVVMLLRLNWLGSAKRASFFGKHMPHHAFVLPDRPIFGRSKKTGKPQSDSCEYAWMHWDTFRLPNRRVTEVVRLRTTPADVRRTSREAAWRNAGLLEAA